jgi:hypothetical protein
MWFVTSPESQLGSITVDSELRSIFIHIAAVQYANCKIKQQVEQYANVFNNIFGCIFF